jgi:YbbR domain-containing protein
MLKSIINVITHDPVRKIFAIVFAFGLWIYVAIGNNYSYQRDIRVMYVGLPDSFLIVDSVSKIDVTFSGRGGALFSIWAAPPKAQCDLKEKSIGRTTISPAELRIPVGYGPLRVDYNTGPFDVAIDRRIEREIEIAVPLKGTPKQGYGIVRVSVHDTVRVVGPQRTLENLSEIPTETLSVRNRSTSFEKELRLEIPSSLLSVTRKRVRATVEIDETKQKTLTFVPLILLYAPGQNVRVDKNYLDTLVIVGTPQRINRLALDDIEIRINLTKLAAGEYEMPAEVILPEYIMPIRSVPRKFKITIY